MAEAAWLFHGVNAACCLVQHIIGKIIQYNLMIGELLLLLKKHIRSHVTCKEGAMTCFQETSRLEAGVKRKYN